MRFEEFEDKLLDSGELINKAGKQLAENVGKIIAFAVALLMLAITFTDIRFNGIFTESFASSLLLLLTSSYIIYFSLEDAGEKCGEKCEEYVRAKERYDLHREKITGELIEELREYCLKYSEREFEFRKRNFLVSHALSDSMLKDYKGGKRYGGKADRILKRATRLKPIFLSPATLLARDKVRQRSELENPERFKLLSLILKLIPSTVCMAITVSVILTAKEGLTATDVLNGIIKLSALPMIGFKGYSAGYSYTKHKLALWNETRANILEGFERQT